jgi:hypothetical protein
MGLQFDYKGYTNAYGKIYIQEYRHKSYVHIRMPIYETRQQSLVSERNSEHEIFFKIRNAQGNETLFNDYFSLSALDEQNANLIKNCYLCIKELTDESKGNASNIDFTQATDVLEEGQ